jgi:hypothetical protein
VSRTTFQQRKSKPFLPEISHSRNERRRHFPFGEVTIAASRFEMRKHGPMILLLCEACATCAAPFAAAHGFAGERFFPPTITTDDPFAADELALPTVSYFKNPGDDGSPATRELDAGFEFDKEIFPHLSLGVSDTYIVQQPVGGHTVSGWDNLQITAKYELLINEPHEAIFSFGLETDIGGTGGTHVGADSFTTFTPKVYFGKGFGDLPDKLDALKPLAVTGVLGQSIPTEAAPNTFQWGLAVEYNLLYLRQHVVDIGMPAPFKDMIPLVEFSFQTAENRGQAGQTTGTINPGVLWESQYIQIGAEALIPVNQRSGENVGAVVQMWIFIDDLFPKYFGHPLFGGQP